MIIFYHLVYQFFKEICLFSIKETSSNNNKQSKEKSKVMDLTKACEDLEFVLSFDPPVYCQRYSAIQEVLINAKWRGTIKKVVDFGCAEFGLFCYVKNVIGLQEVLFVDVDVATLESYITRLYPLNADYLRRRREPLNIKVLHGSIANPSIEVMDVHAVICIEIVEHLYPDTLDAMPYNIFGAIKPRIVIFTTPNADFNVLFPNFSGFRHWDHKFEWTREEFEDWAQNIVSRYPDYTVYFQGIGAGPEGTEKYGKCSQMAVFLKTEISSSKNQEIEYKNFFTNDISHENSMESRTNDASNVNKCKFCEYEKIYDYDFISYGVCSYFSHTYSNDIENNRNDNNQCTHSNLSFKEIGSVEYPVDIDNRTQEERILHDALYKMYRLGSYNGRYYNDELDEADIPLYELTYSIYGEMISIEDLKTILENAGHEIKECDINGQEVFCVVYMPNETMSRSSHRTKSSENQDTKDDFARQTDEESNWDEQVNTDITSELSSDSLPPQNPDENVEEVKQELGESSNSNPPKKIECLYNSGCPISSSSIEMVTPELIRSMQIGKIERKSDAIKAKSEQESVKLPKNQLKRQTMNNPILRLTVMKSDGNIKLQKTPANEDTMPSSTENNEPVEIPSNSNENLCQTENVNVILVSEHLEDIDLSLEAVSQEALYDANSDNNLSDVDFLPAEQIQEYQALFNPIRTGRLPIQVVTTDENTDPSAFPAWLLHLLQVSETDSDSLLDAEPHCYSQGDGLGIHPSVSELSTDSSQSDITVRIPGMSAPRTQSTFLERVTSAVLSENDNSEDYFSVDEETNMPETLNVSIESNLQNTESGVPHVINVSVETDTTNVDESRDMSAQCTESKTTLPEQSTSKKKE